MAICSFNKQTLFKHFGHAPDQNMCFVWIGFNYILIDISEYLLSAKNQEVKDE